MEKLAHLQSQLRVLLALWIGLTLILAPATSLAAPQPFTLAQATTYADPDGRFSLDVPEGFTDEADITYEELGDNPLNGLVVSAGRAFAEPEDPNGVSVLFLLMDEPISNLDEFAGFLAAFQVAAGGETLPLVDLELSPGDTLRATGRATTRERHLQIDVQAQDNVVAVVTASVERARYRGLRDALTGALDSFTWDPAIVLASLGGEAPPPEAADDTQPEPEPTEEPASEEPSEIPRSAPDAALETELRADEQGVYSISVPVGLALEDLSDADEAIYGFGYSAPDEEESTTVAVAVAFTPATYAAQGASGEVDFDTVDDETWNQFLDVFVLQRFEDMSVFTDQRDDINRTAFLVLEGEDEGVPIEVWVWVEEHDGVGALFAVFGDLDDPLNAETFHSAITTFSWSPEAAKTAIATVAGVPDPATTPVVFDDPFDLVSLSTPPDYPFQTAYYDEGSIEYSFGRNPVDGLIQVSISSPSESAYNASGWSIIVDETEQTVLDTMSDGTLGRNGRMVDRMIGEPDAGADNSATILARTDAYWMAVVLLDVDGVLVSEVIIVPDSYWQVYEKTLEAAAQQGVDFDPDAIRDALDANEELGVTVLETGTADEMPARGEEIEWRYTFDTDDSFTVATDFAQTELGGSFKTIIFAEAQPDYPVAQYALWLGEEEHISYGKMTSQEETGTRAAVTYTPDYPSNAGTYIAYIYYDNELLAASGFTIQGDPPESTQIANFGPSYGNIYDGEAPLVTTAVHPADVVTVRGTVDVPAGSQLRLFWYDPDGWLITDEVATIRLDVDFHLPYDWVYFEPRVAWEPGTYGYLLTVDGQALTEGELMVIEEVAEVALTPGGEEIFASLPLPPDLTTVPVVEGIDLAVAPSETFTSRDIVSVVDAWLRMQGWQPALPSIGAPVAWDYRRWVKDGYQFQVEPGTDGAESEVWMRYAPLSDVTFGPLPSGDALDGDSLATMAEVAQLELEGLFANEAAFSPDGNWMAVTTTDGTLYIFDALRLIDTVWWQPDAFYADPVFSPDSRDLAVTVHRQSRSEVQLFSNFDVIWLPTTRFNGHTDTVTAIDYQSDGWLASGGLDGSLRQWEPTGEFLPVMVDTDEPVTGLAAAPEDAPGLLLAREGGWLEYRLDSGEVPWSDVGTVTGSPRLAAWSGFDENGAGDFVAFGEEQAEWYVYDTAEVDLVADLPVEDPEYITTGAAFSPNGALLVISGETILFYDRASGEWLDEWEVLVDGNRVPIIDLGISPDSHYVIVVSDDGMTRLWAASAQ